MYRGYCESSSSTTDAASSSFFLSLRALAAERRASLQLGSEDTFLAARLLEKSRDC